MVKILTSGNCYGRLAMKIKLPLNILKLLTRIISKRYEDGNKYGYFLQGEAASQGESGAGTPGHGETETEGPGAEAENGEDQGAGKHICRSFLTLDPERLNVSHSVDNLHEALEP